MRTLRIALLVAICGLLFCSAALINNLSEPLSKISTSNTSDLENLKSGDIIFQVTTSRQCEAIQHATGSKYSHVGIIFNDADKLYVLEAVQPVQVISLEDFVARGVEGHFVVKRLKSNSLDEQVLKKMETLGRSFIGSNYDLSFEWSDDRMYCSELVWKMYERVTGIEIGKLRPLKDFDLSHPLVKTIMKERYGKIIPMNEMMISPGDMFDSPLLTTVMESS